jgi:CHAD domain-containing protein
VSTGESTPVQDPHSGAAVATDATGAPAHRAWVAVGPGEPMAPAQSGTAGDPAPDPLAAALERLAPGRTPGVRGDDPWAEAGRKVLRFHLARMLARVPGVIAGDDPEDVHAMRVAGRRMRAAWRVFGDGFEREARRRYVGDLREIGARLGAVRDLDVLLEILDAYSAHRSERQRTDLAPLFAAWRGLREARRLELVEVLGADRFRAFSTEYAELALTEGLAAVPVAPHAPALVRHRMPSTAWTAYEAVWAFDDGLAEADLATLHQLRIAGKWLRYTLEFVREPLEPEEEALIGQVVALQDHIGVLHDMHVAATLAREVASGAPGANGATGSIAPTNRQVRAIDRFVRHFDERTLHLQRTLGPTWRPLVAPEYRRRLGRGLARL